MQISIEWFRLLLIIMKKLLFLLILGLCVNAKAQYYIVDFTEEDLLGTWDVTQVSGDFSSIGFTHDSNTFRSFVFNDGTYSWISYYYSDSYESSWSFISFFVTNKHMLHFVSDRKYGNSQTGISMYKLKILHYDGQGQMILRTLTGSGYVTLQKRTTDSSVRSMSAPDGNATYYNLKGEKTEGPSTGINIIKEPNGDSKKVIIK